MTDQDLNPRILVTKPAGDNQQKSGIWINATDDLDGIKNTINRFFGTYSRDAAEGLVVAAFEDFGDIKVDDEIDIDLIHEQAVFIEEEGLFASFMVQFHNGDVEAARSDLDNHYVDSFDSLAAYAEKHVTTNLTDKTGLGINDFLDFTKIGDYMNASNMLWWITDTDGTDHYFTQ